MKSLQTAETHCDYTFFLSSMSPFFSPLGSMSLTLSYAYSWIQLSGRPDVHTGLPANTFLSLWASYMRSEIWKWYLVRIEYIYTNRYDSTHREKGLSWRNEGRSDKNWKYRAHRPLETGATAWHVEKDQGWSGGKGNRENGSKRLKVISMGRNRWGRVSTSDLASLLILSSFWGRGAALVVCAWPSGPGMIRADG